jgi:hypothetical protein
VVDADFNRGISAYIINDINRAKKNEVKRLKAVSSSVCI